MILAAIALALGCWLGNRLTVNWWTARIRRAEARADVAEAEREHAREHMNTVRGVYITRVQACASCPTCLIKIKGDQ